MREEVLAKIMLDVCFKIHRQIGPGLLESAYERVVCHELKKEGIPFVCQKYIPISYKDVVLDPGFRADLIVDDKLIVELKSVASIQDVHKKTLLTYLRLTGLKLGLLINFNEALLKHGITRIVNNL